MLVASILFRDRMRFLLRKIDALLAHINEVFHPEAGTARCAQWVHQQDNAVCGQLLRHRMLKDVEIVPFQGRRDRA